MSRKVWKGFKLLLIPLMILNVIWTILSLQNNIHKQNFLKNQTSRLAETDLTRIKGTTSGDPIDILDLPHKMNSWNLSKEDWEWFFVDNGISRRLVYNGHNVSFAQLSPYHKKMGFFFRPETNSLGEIVLAVLDIDKRVVKEVYRGDDWTSSWEWKGDNSVIVKRSCGTGCMNANVIHVETGEKLEAYRVY